MLFTELNLHPLVMKGIEEAGFTVCTPVQEMTFQKTLSDTDVYVQSQTGTGKTAAFLITIFNLFLTDEKYRHRKALVLTPTRELAVQVEQDAQLLGKYCGIKTGCFYGGVGYVTQDRLLKEDVDLFIGTPGRLIDYQKSHKIDFMKFEILVIDEADRMFDMGFIPDIRFMLKRMVPPAERLTMLYSATLSQRVKLLAWEYMNDPAEIEITPDKLTVDLITQELYHVGRDEKFNLLLGIIRAEKPRSVIIFTNMKRTAERVSKRLAANGVKNDYISGDLPQKQRLQIIDSIKAGKTEILVATDVAARGLHIEELDMVINYDLPDDNQNYVHRIGRTARAGKSGKSITLACEDDVFNLAPIEKLIGMPIPTKWADESLIVEASGAPIHSSRDSGRGRPGDRRGPRRTDRQGRSSSPAPRRDQKRPETAGEAGQSRSRRPARKGNERSAPAPALQEKSTPPAAETSAIAAPSAQAKAKRNRRPRRGKKPEETAAPRQESTQATRQRQPRQESTQAARPRPPRQRSGRPSQGDRGPRLSRDATPEQRLEYFKNKYGENFEKTRVIEDSGKKAKPRTLIESIKGLLKKKK